MLEAIFHLARTAKKAMARQPDTARADLVRAIAHAVWEGREAILEANKIDAASFPDDDPKKDRLLLSEQRIEGMVAAAKAVADLPDPCGETVLERAMENGLRIQKVTVPLGVIGIIYESRPNVTLDAAVLGLRSGNALLLRGSSDAYATNLAIVGIIQKVLEAHNLPKECVQLLPRSRECVEELLTAPDSVDLVIPRGSKNLIDFVRETATVPVIETGAGVCHTYVHESADIGKALAIVENAKTARPSVCNAMDTLLLHSTLVEEFLPRLAKTLEPHQVAIYADRLSHLILSRGGYPFLHEATPEDFGREYLSLGCSIRVVQDMDEALEHIDRYSSKHSEAIVAEDMQVCEQFLAAVDAAAVYSNASTYFTDGGCFGLGAEIGISTQKLHARGPFALEKLVCEKWMVRGDGQIRVPQ